MLLKMSKLTVGSHEVTGFQESIYSTPTLWGISRSLCRASFCLGTRVPQYIPRRRHFGTHRHTQIRCTALLLRDIEETHLLAVCYRTFSELEETLYRIAFYNTRLAMHAGYQSLGLSRSNPGLESIGSRRSKRPRCPVDIAIVCLPRADRSRSSRATDAGRHGEPRCLPPVHACQLPLIVRVAKA